MPEAFYRIQDPEAKRFISRCLENVVNRSSAKELLLDPFLAMDDHHGPPLTLKNIPAHVTEDCILHDHKNLDLSEVDDIVDCTIKRTDMSITGKMNPEGDTIFLKVQIADKEGKSWELALLDMKLLLQYTDVLMITLTRPCEEHLLPLRCRERYTDECGE